MRITFKAHRFFYSWINKITSVFGPSCIRSRHVTYIYRILCNIVSTVEKFSRGQLHSSKPTVEQRRRWPTSFHLQLIRLKSFGAECYETSCGDGYSQRNVKETVERTVSLAKVAVLTQPDNHRCMMLKHVNRNSWSVVKEGK